MSKGKIIILNGTSSSGKTTIAQSLQEIMEQSYLHTGIDQFLIERLPKKLIEYSDGVTPSKAEGWLATFHDDIFTKITIGALGYQWIEGMYRAIAELAKFGLNVIIDDVIYDRQVLEMAVNTLPSEQVYFVGVRCPLEITEQRERERGNRAKGGAKTFHNLVHAHGLYDLEVDSSISSPKECAIQIRDGFRHKSRPTAFQKLKSRDFDVKG